MEGYSVSFLARSIELFLCVFFAFLCMSISPKDGQNIGLF